MKKYLVVLLALAMVFAFATTAFAADDVIPDYTDVKVDTEYANDIYRLTALGVLQGNNGWGGAYRPAEYLTRAEFAKIAVYMYGIEDTVNYYASLKSSFTDVAEGFWAEGYINAALDNGLMKGRGNGIFDPQSTVTTQEVATVVLRAVGYTDELPGAWPTDYINKASNACAWWDEDGTLFEYVDFIGPNAATRGEMAAIVNYALDMYKVSYVADSYTLVYGIGDVDKDGYVYEQWKTNEEKLFDENFFTGAENVTLLWNVFHAICAPTRFEFWSDYDANVLKLAEAGGWGYEDFAEDELQFNLFTPDVDGVHDVVEVPVASNYYIFDTSLGGELWQLAGRAALMTIKVTSVANEEWEALYVDLKTDVEYSSEKVEDIDVANDSWVVDDVYNADIYSDNYMFNWMNADDFAYDYDLYQDLPFGIVESVEDDLVVMHGDAAQVGENGEFCLLDECKKHDLDFLILKDGALGDASVLEENDIVYYAGLLYGDGNGNVDAVELYVAYSPVSVDFEDIAATSNSGIGELTLSGTDFNYKEDTNGALMSDDEGANFGQLDYDYLREIVKEYEGETLFAEAYAKTWVGELIFDYVSNETTYGVVTDIEQKFVKTNETISAIDVDSAYAVTQPQADLNNPYANLAAVKAAVAASGEPAAVKAAWSDAADYIVAAEANYNATDDVTSVTYTFYPVLKTVLDGKWIYDKVTIFDAEGNSTTYDFDQVLYSDTEAQVEALNDLVKVGDLVTFEVDDDEIVTASIGAATKAGRYDGYKVAFNPEMLNNEMDINSKGVFRNDMQSYHTYVNRVLKDNVSYKGYSITADTVVFEVTTKAGGVEFKEVALGDATEYMGVETYTAQYGILDPYDKTVDVLYVVDADTTVVTGYGLMTGHGTDKEDEYVIVNGEKIYVTLDNADTLEDDALYYVGYRIEKGEVARLFYGVDNYGSTVKKGDLVVLADEFGYAFDDADGRNTQVEAILADIYEDYDNVEYIFGRADLEDWDFADDCVAYDLTGEHPGRNDDNTFALSDIDHDENEFDYIIVTDGYNDVIMILAVNYQG